jgi:hypothetical protein
VTTNQPPVTGVSPDPKSSSCASGTDAILAPGSDEFLPVCQSLPA